MLQSSREDMIEPVRSLDVLSRVPPGTFVLNPDNAHRLIGQSQLWKMFKKELLLFVILIGLSGFLLPLAIKGVQDILTAWQVQHVGIAAQGEIIGLRAAPIGGTGQAIAYYLKYRYTVPSGEMSLAEQVVSRKTFERSKVGSAIPIKYLADNPAFSSLADNVLDIGNYFIVLIAAIGLFSTLGIIAFLGWQVWQEEQFFWRGRLIIGHVMSCHAHLQVAPKDLEVELRGPNLGGRYMLDLAYSFRSPAGATIKATAERQRNDLRAGPLPKFGYPVAVLYLSDKCYKIL
jgi:hypothetical protein